GVFIRCSSATELTAKNCYEVNIWDVRPEPKYGTGAIVDVAAVGVPIQEKAGGRWNTYVIRAKGSQLTIELNGVQTASAQNGAHAAVSSGRKYAPGEKRGRVQRIKWRRVQTGPIGAGEPPRHPPHRPGRRCGGPLAHRRGRAGEGDPHRRRAPRLQGSQCV